MVLRHRHARLPWRLGGSGRVELQHQHSELTPFACHTVEGAHCGFDAGLDERRDVIFLNHFRQLRPSEDDHITLLNLLMGHVDWDLALFTQGAARLVRVDVSRDSRFGLW